ncbi:MAG: EexN family lipoprotein [Pseudomonadota bacterium]
MNVFFTTVRTLSLLPVAVAMLGCDSEPPARTVEEFKANPILLEAAVVRCAENRSETRYTEECMNAREAVKILEAAEEAERRQELEAQSERKRQALRRTQQAAAEARRRAAEEQRRRKEAEYLAQFGELPPEAQPETVEGNAPMAVLPEPVTSDLPEPISSPYDEVAPPRPANNSPMAETPLPNEQVGPQEAIQQPAKQPAGETPTDLEAIREELKRRGEDSG